MTEKRRNDRYDLLMPIHLSPSDGAGAPGGFVAETRNISSTGALIHTSKTLPVGTEVEMELFLDVRRLLEMVGEKRRVKVRLEGRVVRNHDGAIAVSFNDRYEFDTA